MMAPGFPFFCAPAISFMPSKGKRSMVGIPGGPCNNANLSGKQPASLVGLRRHGDAQLRYRFPITMDTHAALETKEWLKGQQHLCEEVKDQKTGYREPGLPSACEGWCMELLRHATSSSTLLTRIRHQDCAGHRNLSIHYPRDPCATPPAGPRWTSATDSPPWALCGGRGQLPEVHLLSAYEFPSRFYVKQA